MKQTNIFFISVLTVFLAFSGIKSKAAQPNIYEGFNYTVGDPLPNVGGVGWKSNGAYWTGVGGTFNNTYPYGVTNVTPLTVAGLQQIGNYFNGHAAWVSTFFRGINTAWDSPYVDYLSGGQNTALGKINTTLWFSVILRPQLNQKSAALGVGRATDNTSAFRIGAIGKNFWGINANNGAEEALSSVPVVNDQAKFVVCKVEFNGTLGGGGTLSLYIDPIPGTEPVTAAATLTTTADLRFFYVQLITAVNYNTAGAMAADEIRIASTYALVAPQVPPVNVAATSDISALTLTAASDVVVTNTGVLTLNENKQINSLTVQPGGKLTLNNGVTLTTGAITLSSNASGTATLVDNGGTLTVTTATVQQYMPQGRNWYLSAPIVGGNTSSITGAGATSVSYYSEQNGWQHNYSGALTAGVGYVAVSNSGSATNNAAFTGTLNTGDVTVTLTRKSSGSAAGYNLIANPYPSYINPMAAINANANLVKTIWYRTRQTGNTYKFETVNTTSGVGTNNAGTGTVRGYIPPMQAFWVRTNADNQTFTFTNTMRTHANPVVGQTTISTTAMKAPKTQQALTRLQVTGATGSDEAVVYFNSNAANSYDGYDSPKMFESATVTLPEIYTLAGADKLVINGLNSVQYETEIPLGFTAKQAGDYSISTSEFTNFEAGTRVILKDGGIETELTEGTAYSFNVLAPTSTTERFSLLFRAPGVATGLESGKTNVKVYVNTSNQITIIGAEKASYSIYNAMGQQIENGIINSKHETWNKKLNTGVYFVKVNNTVTKVVAN